MHIAFRNNALHRIAPQRHPNTFRNNGISTNLNNEFVLSLNVEVDVLLRIKLGIGGLISSTIVIVLEFV